MRPLQVTILYSLILICFNCSFFREETSDIEDSPLNSNPSNESSIRWVDILDGSTIRKEPGEDSPILAKLSFRAKLKVINPDKTVTGWEYVEWKSKKGWVLQEDISLEPPGASNGFVPEYLEDICDGIQNSLECYKAVETKVIMDGAPASRNGNTLTVKLSKDKTLQFIDNPSEDDKAEFYNYIDYQVDSGVHLIQLSKYESGHLLGIHDQSGQMIQLLDYPEFSPDGFRFATAFFCPNSNYCENGIQIYKIQSEGFREEYSFKSSTWNGSDPIWLDGQRISLFFYGNGYMEDPTEKGILKIKNGKWILVKEDM